MLLLYNILYNNTRNKIWIFLRLEIVEILIDKKPIITL